jgi:hypothetical protein
VQSHLKVLGKQPTPMLPNFHGFESSPEQSPLPTSMIPYSTYILVDSLYGPGTFIAWLLTMISLLIDWSLNKSMRRDDTLTLNLIAALVLPIVSTGHFTYQMTRLPAPVSRVITSTKSDDMAFVAAFEAPLDVCETFSWVSLILVLPCISWNRGLTRKLCFWMITSTGLLCWTTETFLYSGVTAKGVQIRDTVLSRPYVFQFTPIMVLSWTFIIGCLVLFGGSKLVHFLQEHQPQGQEYRGRSNDTTVPILSIGAATGLYMPISFIVFFFAMVTQGDEFLSTVRHLGIFFIPKSQGSLANLDQAVALGIGVTALLYSIKSAYDSQCSDATLSSGPSGIGNGRRWPSHTRDP